MVCKGSVWNSSSQMVSFTVFLYLCNFVALFHLQMCKCTEICSRLFFCATWTCHKCSMLLSMAAVVLLPIPPPLAGGSPSFHWITMGLTGGEVEHVEMMLSRYFSHQIKGQKMKKRKYIKAFAANKQTKIHNNQQIQRRRWERGIKKNVIGVELFGRTFSHRLGRGIEWSKKNNKKNNPWW